VVGITSAHLMQSLPSYVVNKSVCPSHLGWSHSATENYISVSLSVLLCVVR